MKKKFTVTVHLGRLHSSTPNTNTPSPTLYNNPPLSHLAFFITISSLSPLCIFLFLFVFWRLVSGSMEVQEEVMGSNDQAHIIKGKRTKRLRLSSPLALTMICSSSNGAEGEGGGRVSDYSFGGVDGATTTSPNTSTDQEFVDESTEEEEDMANCLILLAQGHSRKVTEPASAATASKAAGFYAYQCKTCDRCFPSFQALGGHRASHKRPKAVAEEKRTWATMEEENNQFIHTSTALSLQIPNRGLLSTINKSRVHECSVCGAEFSSGQALGGHMRRHRTSTGQPPAMVASIPESQEAKKPRRNILQLDLNLPAPGEDDHRDSKFPFVPKGQTLVFSASHLVDCHY